MDRRRGIKRPPSTEERDYWRQVVESLNTLAQVHNDPSTSDNVTKVNKYIGMLPSEESVQAEGTDILKTLRHDMVAALGDLKTSAEKEAKAIEEALERLSVLTAMRKAPETLPQEKRVKRMRLSPSSQPNPSHGLATPPISQAVPGRASPALGHKLRKEQQLQVGRKVAFHQVASKTAPGGKTGADPSAEGENEWILAVVTKTFPDRTKYEVQDLDEGEDGKPSPTYNTTLRHLIPLPDPDAATTSPSHPNAYEEFSTGATVLGLYPDTSCFYRAQVVAGPRDPQPGARTVVSSKSAPQYRLRFEDDDDQIRTVSAEYVVHWPGDMRGSQ